MSIKPIKPIKPMRHAISSYVFTEQKLTPPLLDQLARAGAEAIEIFCARQHFDYRDPRQVEEIAAWFASSGVPLHSLHSPLYTDTAWGEAGGYCVDITALAVNDRNRAVDEVLSALTVAQYIPFQFLVQHVGMAGDELARGQLQAAQESVHRIAAAADSCGVQLLLENIPNQISAPSALLHLLSLHPQLAVCFDVGHAHMAGGVEAEFQQLQHHIRSTHVHDNCGTRDSHRWPGGGDVDWKAAMHLLRRAPLAPPLLLEINGDNTHADGVEAALKSAFAFLEGL